MTKNSFPKYIPAAQFLILAAGVIIRAYHIGYHDLWYDEIITIIRICKLSIFKIPDPSLYYFIMAGWTKIFGFSEASLRVPSLLFNSICILLIFLLGKELFNRRCGLYAALLTALSPFHLWYAQEARCYSMLACCALASAVFQYRSIVRQGNKAAPGTRKYIYASLACAIAGLYTHPYYIFFAAAQGICFFVYSTKGRFSRPALWIALAAAAFLPLLAQSWTRLAHTLNAYWIPSPGWKSLAITFENLGLGYNSHRAAYRLFDAIAVVLCAAALRRWRNNPEERKAAGFSCLLLLFPILAAFTFSRLFVPVYLDRGLIIAAPFYYLLLGAGLDALGRKLRALFLAAALLLLAMGIQSFFTDAMPTAPGHHVGVHLKKPFKAAVKFLKANSGDGDIIAFTNDSLKLPLIWYSEKKNHVFFDKRKKNKAGRLGRFRFIFAPGCLTPSYMEPKEESEFNIPLEKAGDMEFKRLFVLSCDWPRGETLDNNSCLVKKRLDENLQLKLEREFQGMWVYCYEKR